jgi:transmembrane sensor
MTPQRPLSDFVKPPEVSTAALSLEWHEVKRRVRRHRQVRVASTVVAALLLAGVVAGVVLRRSEESFTTGQVAVALDVARTLKVSDGSEVTVSPGASITLATAEENEVVLVLERGSASFDVAKKPTRRFVVKADGIEVRVVGTKFTVQREGRQVDVAVARGIVEVREGDVVKRLEKGARWSRSPAVVEALPAVVPTEEEIIEAEAAIEPETDSTENAPSVTTTRRPKHRKPKSVQAPVASAPLPQAPPAEEPKVEAQPKSNEPTPADTFATAMRARADGHAKDAIRGFQQVCERWPSSAYAPMSAFEWGRLALDTQDDPRQAAHAFERTLELATSASLVEDALARLSEAYARYDVGSCRRVQAEYLRRFPGGPHVRGVSKACPP